MNKEDEVLIKKCWKEGLSTAQAAKKLNLNTSTLNHRCRKLGIKLPTSDEVRYLERQHQIKPLLDKNMTFQQIQKKTKIPTTVLYDFFKRSGWNVESDRKREINKKREIIKSMRKDGKTPRQISKILKISESTTGYYLYKAP